ncbi:MAG: GTPase Era [Armatimonadetes bacterium]|nr:MAG: GTPase Era [Armatimonadota bacterium]
MRRALCGKMEFMKVGTVALIGRPNTGKSTLVNALVGHKVAITSPKPQTTQFPVYAVYENEFGQIVFVDTPGIFSKTHGARSKQLNLLAGKVLKEEGIAVVLYLVDHTRERGFEENRVLGIVRKVDLPKILVINKIDVREPTYIEQYRFLEDEFDSVVRVSALKAKNLPILIEEIFKYLKEGKRIVVKEDLAIPALNVSSELYISEVIREKAFLVLRREIPYSIRVVVDSVEERKEKDMVYMKAKILTTSLHYKKMIIGKNAEQIKEIGMMARKEFERASGRKVYLDLTVEVE